MPFGGHCFTEFVPLEEQRASFGATVGRSILQTRVLLFKVSKPASFEKQLALFRANFH